MKFLNYLMPTLAALLLFSCDVDNEPIIPDNKPRREIELFLDQKPLQGVLSLTQKDTVVEIEVVCDGVWGVTISEQKWAVVSSERTKNSFVVTLPSSNMNPESREATIRLSCDTLLFTLIIRQAGSNATATVSDSLVLVQLYNELDGKYWRANGVNVEWNLKEPIEKWYGVKLNADRRITTLMLAGVGMDGVLPPQIGLLNQLITLNLSANQIKGEIPVQIGDLAALESLSIDNNKFTGELPLSIVKLKHLREIMARGNRFKVFPVGICALDSLTYIALEDNQIEQLPGQVTSMSRLRYLYLNNNKLAALPLGLDKMPSLVYLHAQNNMIEALPDELGNLTKLLSLNLSDNKIAQKIPESITNLTNLKYLYLSNNAILGEIPKGMERMKALEVIELSNNKLTGIMPDWGLNPRILRVRVDGNTLQGDISAYFASCPLLENLTLSDNLLSGTIPRGLADIKKAPKLIYLALNNNNLTGTIPAGFADQLNKWNPSFNKSGFLLYGNRLSGEIPEIIFTTGLGNLDSQFKFATNVYIQQEGFNFTNTKK